MPQASITLLQHDASSTSRIPAWAAMIVWVVFGLIGGVSHPADSLAAQAATKRSASGKKPAEAVDDPEADTKVAGREAATLQGHRHAVLRLAFHPTLPLLCSTSKDGRVLLWDLTSNSLKQELATYKEEVWTAKFSPDGASLAYANRYWWGSVVKFMAMPAPYELRALKDFKYGGGAVASLAFSPDGLLFVTGQDDGVLRIWETYPVYKEAQPLPMGAALPALAFGLVKAEPKKRTREYLLAVGCADGPVKTLRAVSAQTKFGAELKVEPTNVAFPKEKGVLSLRFSPNGQLLATTRIGGQISLLEPDTGKIVRDLRASNANVDWISFHPTRPWIVTAHFQDHSARIWNYKTGEMLTELKGHADGLFCVEFSRDGRHVATASADFLVKLWDLEGPGVPQPAQPAKRTKGPPKIVLPLVGD